MRELIQGAYDLHVHTAPDVLPRRLDDFEMAQRVMDSGMAGFAMKSHYFCTGERAAMTRKLYPACDAVGTITLNGSVGGINPAAVEMAARAGTKLVWFPTSDSAHEQNLTLGGDRNPDKKLPYWAQVVLQMREEGIDNPVIRVVGEDGRLTEATHQVLEVIAGHQMILATSHLSHEETFALVRAAKEHRVEHIIITHVDFPTTFYTVEEQMELLRCGAYMEHCFVTYNSGKVDFEVVLKQIRAIGARHIILSTDLGQKTGIYPDEGLEQFVTSLYDRGISEEDIKKMTSYNQRILLGKA